MLAKYYFGILVFGFLFAGVPVSSQNDSLLRYSKYPGGSAAEKYYIRLPDSAKHGPAERYTNEGELLAKGYYKNNKKVGLWSFYTEGRRPSVWLRYNYSTNTEEEYKSQVPVRSSADALRAGVQSQEAHYPGGDMLFYDQLWLTFDRLQGSQKLMEDVELQVVFKVNTNGSLDSIYFTSKNQKAKPDQYDFRRYKFQDKRTEDFLRLLLQSMTPWYPEVQNGKPRKSQWISMPLNLRSKGNKSRLPEGLQPIGRQVPWGNIR